MRRPVYVLSIEQHRRLPAPVKILYLLSFRPWLPLIPGRTPPWAAEVSPRTPPTSTTIPTKTNNNTQPGSVPSLQPNLALMLTVATLYSVSRTLAAVVAHLAVIHVAGGYPAASHCRPSFSTPLTPASRTVLATLAEVVISAARHRVGRQCCSLSTVIGH